MKRYHLSYQSNRVTKKRSIVSGSLLLLLLLSIAPRNGGVLAQASSRTFPETGKTVSGRFLQVWESRGGVYQQGYPITERFAEQSDTDGHVYFVQYFERSVFEEHPENKAPYDVLLQLLGVAQLREDYGGNPPNQRPSSDKPRIFSETGKTLGGVFRRYWENASVVPQTGLQPQVVDPLPGGLLQNTSVSQYGYPITNEFTEVSPLNNRPYLVQYFERAVFEYHPEYAGTPYEVLLSQLGTIRFNAKYVIAPPPPRPVIAKVTKVIDGDSIEVILDNSTRRIDYLGIQAS